MSLVKEIFEDVMTIYLDKMKIDQNSDIYEKNTITYFKNLNMAVIIACVHINNIHKEDVIIYIVDNPDIEKLKCLTNNLEVRYNDQGFDISSNFKTLQQTYDRSYFKVYLIDFGDPDSQEDNGWMTTYYSGKDLDIFLNRTVSTDNLYFDDGYRIPEAFSIFNDTQRIGDKLWLKSTHLEYIEVGKRVNLIRRI